MTKPALSPDLQQLLADNNPIGMTLTTEDVAAWWDMIWLSFESYEYTTRGRKKAIISWWRRTTEEDIEKARARTARIRDEEVDRYVRETTSNVVPIDHFAKLG